MIELPVNLDPHSPGRLRVECCLCDEVQIVEFASVAGWTVVHFLENHPAWRPA